MITQNKQVYAQLRAPPHQSKHRPFPEGGGGWASDPPLVTETGEGLCGLSLETLSWLLRKMQDCLPLVWQKWCDEALFFGMRSLAQMLGMEVEQGLETRRR